MTATGDWREAEREYTDEVTGSNTIAQLFDESAQRHAAGTAQLYKGGVYGRSLAPAVVPAADPQSYESLSYAQLHDIVKHLSAGFADLGVDPGTRVGILANTRMEWAQSDLAVLAAGGVVTTVYTESSPDQVQYLLDDPGASGVVVENRELLDRVVEVEDDLDLEFIVVIDDYDGYEDRDDVFTLHQVHDRGAEEFDQAEYEQRLQSRDLDDLASLIYTSGTTGKPKGVKLTHGNFRANINQIRKRFGPRPDKAADLPALTADTTALSFLPLAHVFERTSGHFLMFASGATVGYAESPDTLQEDFQLVGPDTATSVPRVYEKLFDAMREQAASSSTKERIFEWALGVGRKYGRTDNPGAGLRFKHWLSDRLVFSTVKEGLGGNIDFFISGGGSLNKELAELFRGMGLDIYEGYGLTETAPVVSVNPPEDPRPGTLGVPLVDMDTRLDESVTGEDQRRKADGPIGELQVKGPNVTEGYWHKPDATDEAFTEDGYFRTGDIVEEAGDDFLVYHDRLKQLIVLSTGKNVAPGPIEDAFATSSVVEQVMVLGDDEKFIGALVVPSVDGLRRWADNEGIDLPDDDAALCDDDRVRERIQQEVDRVNERFEKHETIKQFRLVPLEWTPENDLLTSSMKLKRRNIRERFQGEIDAMYE